MGKLGLNSGYIGSDQRITTNGVVGYDKFYLERKAGRFNTVLDFIIGLLDLYPNAAAAYSLRKLKFTYQGNAIRVRRSSDNTEQDIGFDFNGNLNIAGLLAFCGAGNGFVTTWYDQSGTSNNATQTTAASQPQIVSSGSVILDNGKPSFQFDGVDDGLQLNSYSSFDIGNLSSFVVGRYDTLGNTMIFGLSGATGNKRWYAPFATLTTFRFGYAGNVTATSTAGDVNQHLFTMIAGSTLGNMESWIDANSIGTATLDSGNDPQGGIGNFDNGFYANCKVQEIIVYNSDQSSNRIEINTNINDFYSIY
jgi:hypothetical protein